MKGSYFFITAVLIFMIIGLAGSVWTDTAQVPNPTFAGEWNVTTEDYTYGSLNIYQSYWIISISGNTVTVYDQKSQYKATGIVSGNTLTCKWNYDPTPENKFVITLSADGNSFKGNYEGWFAVGGKTWGNYYGKRVFGGEIKESDKDQDGVPDCIDLCPSTPGLVNSFGCPKDQRVGKMINFVSITLKQQIADFLSCVQIPQLPAIQADEWDIELDSQPGASPEFVQADNLLGMVWRSKNAQGIPFIRADLPAFINFVQAELSLKCQKPLTGGAKSHGDFYHEIGHLLADQLNLVRVDPYGEHQKWHPFDTATSAFDEARADLFMVLLSRHLKRPIRDSFGLDKARENIPSQYSGKGHFIAEANTSLLLDLLPEDPCAAARLFYQAEQSPLSRNMPPDIDAWLVGYFDAVKKYPIAERIKIEQQIAQKVKAYGIDTRIGFVEEIDDPELVDDIQLNEESASFLNPLSQRLVKRVNLRQKPGRIKVYGPNIKVCTLTPLGWYQAISIETEFETVLSVNKEITTVVLDGSVEIAPPGQKPFILKKGQAFTWSQEK